MSYSTQIANTVRKFLTADDWNFSFDDEKGIFTFNLTVKTKMKKISYRVLINDNGYSVYAASPLGADDCLHEMAEFICRANYGLRNGNFELDFRDGEVRYKCYVNCDGQMPSTEIVKDSIYVPYFMMKRYGDGIISVIFGNQTAEEAVRTCEAD
jgi:hypothetical protein